MPASANGLDAKPIWDPPQELAKQFRRIDSKGPRDGTKLDDIDPPLALLNL